MKNTDIKRALSMLDSQYKHYNEYMLCGDHTKAGQQLAYYSGFYTAYNDLLLGSGLVIIRDRITDKHFTACKRG